MNGLVSSPVASSAVSGAASVVSCGAASVVSWPAVIAPLTGVAPGEDYATRLRAHYRRVAANMRTSPGATPTRTAVLDPRDVAVAPKAGPTRPAVLDPREVLAALCVMVAVVEMHRAVKVALMLATTFPASTTRARVFRAVATLTGVTRAVIASPARTARIVAARYLVIWLLSQTLGWSLLKIGGQINRDHTSVLHGLRKIERQRAANPRFREQTDLLLRACR